MPELHVNQSNSTPDLIRKSMPDPDQALHSDRGAQVSSSKQLTGSRRGTNSHEKPLDVYGIPGRNERSIVCGPAIAGKFQNATHGTILHMRCHRSDTCGKCRAINLYEDEQTIRAGLDEALEIWIVDLPRPLSKKDWDRQYDLLRAEALRRGHKLTYARLVSQDTYTLISNVPNDGAIALKANWHQILREEMLKTNAVLIECAETKTRLGEHAIKKSQKLGRNKNVKRPSSRGRFIPFTRRSLPGLTTTEFRHRLEELGIRSWDATYVIGSRTDCFDFAIPHPVLNAMETRAPDQSEVQTFWAKIELDVLQSPQALEDKHRKEQLNE